MANTFMLKIITPDNEVFNGEVISFNTATLEGHHEFLSHHANSIVSVKPTISVYRTSDGVENKLFTSTGIVKVKNNELVLCCDAAETPDEVDASRAMEAKDRAEMRLKDSDKVDVERAKAALARAMVRLEIKNYN